MSWPGWCGILAIEVLRENPPEGVGADWVETFVAGHRKEEEAEHGQFSYLPLPSIGDEAGDGQVRRVMVVGPRGAGRYVGQLAGLIDGRQLLPESGESGPILRRIGADEVVRRYVEESAVWASVTPVVLPGRDDRKPAKTRKLMERALGQAGVDEACELEWSTEAYFRNALSAHSYDGQGRFAGYHRPEHLKVMTAIHVCLRFGRAVAGPVAIGSGRHCGLGVLAGIDSRRE